ncbi:MAG: anaerobic carbon-monoxide dehydrogenase catalytic subunit [bacterium]
MVVTTEKEKKVEKKIDELTGDKASMEMLQKARTANIETVWDRHEKMSPRCKFGEGGICCRECGKGPCRITSKAPQGVCGADDGLIAARNLAKMTAGGSAAHSDHGRAVAEIFLAAAKGKAPGYQIKNEIRLHQVAKLFGINTVEKTNQEIAIEVGELALSEFSKQDDELTFIKRAPEKRQEIWKKLGIVPRGIDREVVHLTHQIHTGVSDDIEDISLANFRCGLADGWGGSMIATELQDVLFGAPVPVRSRVNLGVLKEDEVNIIVHGHEPILSELVVAVSSEPEMIQLAKEQGAKGINIAGICCTANEVLMRHGIPLAGNFLQQELAIMTGAVEAMIVDVQCIMQSLTAVASCFHTKIITTSKKAKIPGAIHIEFDEHDAINTAKEIVKRALLNFKNRKKDVVIPKQSMELIAGFTHEYVNYMLGGRFRASYRPLNDNVINGRIKGVVGIVGCNNPKVKHDAVHLEVTKELIANDILVVQTGCAAITCAKEGLLLPEAAAKYAGKGLAEVCEAVGMPPVLHCGSCVDNSRILIACTEMVHEGGLGDDISELPVVGIAPEWMSEKAIAIGHYVVASGIFTIFGVTYPVIGSESAKKMVFEKYGELVDGKFALAVTPSEIVNLTIDHINKKRKALGIDKPKERILYDMEMRRELKF